MNDLFYALEETADGAFIVDEHYHIQAWNQAAEMILGFKQSAVVEQLCYQIIQGSNEGETTICMDNCLVFKLLNAGKLVPSYDIQAHTNSGDKRWLNMSIITFRTNGGNKKFILHMFRDVSKKKSDEIFFHRFLEQVQHYPNITIEQENAPQSMSIAIDLTKRQKEVLNLLVHGSGTREIAETLSISRNTVRNHIQNILQILQVHSRLEAVAYALENNLLEP